MNLQAYELNLTLDDEVGLLVKRAGLRKRQGRTLTYEALVLAGIQLCFEVRFRGRPLGIDNAEIDRVPDAAGRSDHVIAEDAFFSRANAQDGRAGFFV
jgi:hypothetical protein